MFFRLAAGKSEPASKGAGAKLIFDILVSALVLIVVGWLLMIPIILIRLSSPGPAIFAQRRVGRHQKTFVCYKLRTMDVNTPSAATHETSASAITPLGKWLRRLKIDELPQLLNVLKGEMSLVGPRPCLPEQRELIRLREQLNVFSVRPGITGKAQVQSVDMSDPERLAEIDAQYVRTQSFIGDIVILIQTLTGQGSGDRIRQA